MHVEAFSIVRQWEIGGRCNWWLRIMRLTHHEGMIAASSQARLSQSACKSGDLLLRGKQGSHVFLPVALCLVIVCSHLFPSYLLVRCV